MAGRVSNPRDLFVLLLGELLHVERRLAGGVLRSLADAVHDDQLTGVLVEHLAETREHVERIERVFRRLEVAPSAHLSRAFESAVAETEELASSIVEPRLEDLFRAQAALHTEHGEIAAYTALLELSRQLGREEECAELRESLADELRACDRLEEALRDL